MPRQLVLEVKQLIVCNSQLNSCELFVIGKSKTFLLQKVKTNTSLAAPGALAHRLQRRTACKIQNGR